MSTVEQSGCGSKLDGDKKLEIRLETLLTVREILKDDMAVIGKCEHEFNYCSCDIQEALRDISLILKNGGIDETKLDTRNAA